MPRTTITVALDATLADRLAARAQQEGRPPSSHLRYLLEQDLRSCGMLPPVDAPGQRVWSYAARAVEAGREVEAAAALAEIVEGER